jgi:DNA adenine methylase
LYENSYSKEEYLAIREAKNEESSGTDETCKAARFIYLNKTCFNGLYRVNSKGKFNTPFGKYKNPSIFDEKNLLRISLHLNKSTLTNLDFKEALKRPRRGDLVYIDPPYIPISKTANFTSYNGGGFSLQDHIDLARISEKLMRRGVHVVISNSYCDKSLEIFKNFKFSTIEGDRNISGGISGREKKKEMIIYGLKD